MDLEKIIKTYVTNATNFFELDKKIKENINKNCDIKLDYFFAVGIHNHPGVFIENNKEKYLSLSIVELSNLKWKKNNFLNEIYVMKIKNKDDIYKENNLEIIKNSVEELMKKDLIERNENLENKVYLFTVYFHEFSHSLYNSVENKRNIKNCNLNSYIANEVIAYSLESLTFNLMTKENFDRLIKGIKNNEYDKMEKIYYLTGLYIANKLKKSNIEITKNNKIKINSYIQTFNFLYNVLNEIIKDKDLTKIEKEPFHCIRALIKEFYSYLDELNKEKEKFKELFNHPIKML